jgi:hypothetical protein
MPSFKEGYAIIVGVGADLPVTVRDANAVTQLLKDSSRCAFPANQVWQLTEKEASRDAFLSKLDALAQSAQQKSTVIIYFSGHGVRIRSSKKPGLFYLLTHGYDTNQLSKTCISGQEFTDKLRAIQCKKQLVLLDCCYAGGIAQPKTPDVFLDKSPLPPEFERVLADSSGRVVLASSRADEVSYPGTPYSQFTLALLEALAGAGAAEKDGFARVLDIALYVGRMVANRTSDKQHPILKVSNLEDNFAVAYYANGAKEPLSLPQNWETEVSASTWLIAEETELLEGYHNLHRTYQRNLLEIEIAMSRFIDQRDVPPDLVIAKKLLLDKITEINKSIKSVSTPTETPTVVAASSVLTPTLTATNTPSQQYRILVDTYHGEHLVEDGTLDSWKLQNSGLVLETTTNSVTLDELSGYDGLVIHFSGYGENNKHFTEDEIRGIREYINQGGNVFLIGLGWVWTTYVEKPIEEYPLNIIAEGSGIYFTDRHISDVAGVHYEEAPITFRKPFMAEHSITEGVNQIGASKKAPGSLNVSLPAVPIVWGDASTIDSGGISNPIILAASSVGKGKIVCLQHGSYVVSFVDKYDDQDFPDEYDNLELLENILAWLVSE